MLRVVVCVSGGGTNLQAIIDAVRDGRIVNTEIVRVISNEAALKLINYMADPCFLREGILRAACTRARAGAGCESNGRDSTLCG